VAEVKNLYQVPGFVHSVINQNRAVDKLSYPRSFADDSADPWKAGEQINVIKQGVTEA